MSAFECHQKEKLKVIASSLNHVSVLLQTENYIVHVDLLGITLCRCVKALF